MKWRSNGRRGINMKKQNSGSIIVLGAALALAVAFLVIGLSKLMNFNTHQTVYLDHMNSSYRLAETGMNAAVGRIVSSPRNYADLNGTTITTDDGTYNNVVTQTDSIIPSGYYIVTSANFTAGGRSYASRLHTHLRVSNVADYFAAVSDEMVLSDGIDVSQGRVYAPKITFMTDQPALITKVKSVEYVTSCTPPVESWDAGLKAQLVVSEPVLEANAVSVDELTVQDTSKANLPAQLPSPIVFPQISPSDMSRYQTLAGPHTAESNFSGDIFPPGYTDAGGGCTKLIGDTYANHTCDNTHHIYYSAGDINIGNAVIHGQIIFVSGTGNINITGSIVSADVSADLPGTGAASSSTAHQAVLITRQDVIIKNTLDTSGNAQLTENIQAMILAPHGQLKAEEYNPTTLHSRLSLNFKGALILGHLPSAPPGNLASVFKGTNGRVYGYMNTLKTNPPPYLPAIIDIYYSSEENTSQTGLN